MPFVNRLSELQRIEQLAREARRGRPERHLAFVGVRRIGKSRIIEHYRDDAPEVVVVSVQMDSATSTIPTFLRTMVRETLNGLARRRGVPLVGKTAGDAEIAGLAGALGPDVSDLAQRAIAAASARKADPQHLLETGLSFPERVSAVTGEPFLVFADEFQHIVDLAVYPPFDAGRRRKEEDARGALLGVVRAQIERPNHVGWLVTGSSVRMLQTLLGSGPLMGRFDVVQIQPFDEDACQQLATAIWSEAEVDALDSAQARVFRLTQGHPFYADVACREAANTARRLEQPVSAGMVDGAFVSAIMLTQGQIAIACKEMYDSLGSRAPGLRGFVDALSSGEPATLSEIGERMGLGLSRALYRYVDDLTFLGIVEPAAEGQVVFADPVFRYWVARASDPTTVSTAAFDPEASRRVARVYEEAYLRERSIHGTLTEGFIRDTCRAFAEQQIEGKRLGVPGGHIRLPAASSVTSVYAFDREGSVFGRPADVELDLCFGVDQVWLGEVKRTSRRAGVTDIALLERKAAFLRGTLSLPAGPAWYISLYGFEGAARDAARQKGIYASDLQDMQAIRAAVGTRQ